jgi:D-alanyl-D-alanine carboxypeptidase (penicillin-binding protein 5/6)
MLFRQPRKIEHWLTRTISWALFLTLSFALLLGSLTRLASLGPAGAAHPNHPIMYGGAVGFSVGQPPSVTARSAYVFDADLGFAYFNYHANDELPMASCTKIMTALLAVEHGSLDQVITVGADAHALVRADSSYMGLGTGEKLTLRDLLYGLVLPSGNDAAIAIADGISGNVTDFVALMNQRAAQLGLAHTHFMNPHGLGAPNHYTSARDLAVLAGVAMKNPELVKITSTVHYSIPKTATHAAYELETGDDLLSGARAPYPGAIGVKPGFTGDAGYCQAFAAIRHGHLIVGVVLGEPSWQIRIVDMHNLLDWGFAQESIPPAPPTVPWSHPSPNL